ncbi:NO-associated protein 1 [Abeliophyllum distichum]|uniref:NO-associated protein 1 n=1 Tax=Abeliophyllum distichum TaxID=126358 RepID=A0ABD1VRR6_9LAMI
MSFRWSRGHLFLERHISLEAYTTVLSENKETKKKNKEKGFKVSSYIIHSCYGWGAPLQTSKCDAPGYVDTETYNLKKKHRQLRTVLCGRFRLLSHGHMITAVGGNGGYSGGKQFVTAEELREKLSHLRHEKALTVKLGRDVYILYDFVHIAAGDLLREEVAAGTENGRERKNAWRKGSLSQMK